MKKFKYLPKNKISKLPKTAGVYCFKADGKFLYIGKAANLRDRVNQHRKLLNLVKQLGFIEINSETEALLLEAKLIKRYQPKYNIDWKDDKNYFYVGITKEPFPRVFITHQPKNDGCRTSIIGPFVDGKRLKQVLKDLRKVYPYRTCKALPQKPCLWYHLNQCPAPCVFWGQRLEAYDISNIQGKEATGAMVTFINGKPDKNFYRRFKIKSIATPNDVAMLKEILLRRSNHPEWGLPDMILIDGGKAQLNVAIEIRNSRMSNFCIMALAKKENKLYIEEKEKPVLLKNLPREFSDLILRARDEAHRFARAYHHYLRKKSFML